MDKNAIADAVHEIDMMVETLVRVVEKLQANDATPKAFELSYNAGEMVSFAPFDLHKRIKALWDGLT